MKINKAMVATVLTAIFSWLYFLTKIEIPQELQTITIAAVGVIATVVAGFLTPKK